MTIWTNDTYIKRFVLQDSLGVAVNLTGKTLKAEFKWKRSDLAPVFTISTDDDSIVITSAVDGEFEWRIPQASVDGLKEATIYFDVIDDTALDVPQRLFGGSVPVKKGVTAPRTS